MEEGMSQVQGLSEQKLLDFFAIEKPDIRTYSPLTLAFLGDGVYSVMVRTLVVGRGNMSPAKLHKTCAGMENAKAQMRVLEKIENDLTEEEGDIVRRGRNAKPHTMAKNASVTEYLAATGFEALLGWLYIREDYNRLYELVRTGLIRAGLIDAD